MEIATTVAEARGFIRSWRSHDLAIGLVPTMGYLHEGHASLIQKAREECDRVVVSVFVNPTQFAPNEDLAKYPRDFAKDVKLCESLGVGLIFHPSPEEMYPPGYATYVEDPKLSENLCGRSRPTHFRGVLTVVLKLFLILEPTRAYFGLKDAQQFFILKRMVTDLNLDIALVPGPTVRELNGLALSSRNSYLSEEEKKAALSLNQALTLAKSLLRSGERQTATLIAAMKGAVAAEPLVKLDYAEIVETTGLSLIPEVTGEALVALAAYVGKTRLIDNFLWEGEDKV
ncbi:MAG: pantoate--beta-alanine ligase [Deltaproteobacteria bacterium]|jgi:pantoate--beta-alanine ligase|nr:pantoate--beta-alanine ligase [Deltaproteobacteria bacterium]